MKRRIDLAKDDLWTASELAARLKSTTPSIRTQTSKGVIPASVIIRVGRKTLYSRLEVERWLSGLQREVAP